MTEENKNLEEIIKKYIDIVLEDSKSNFKILADGQQVLERKMDTLETRFDNLENRFDNLETKVDLLVEDMDYVKSKIVEIDEKLDKKAEKTVTDDYEKRLVKLEKTALTSA